MNPPNQDGLTEAAIREVPLRPENPFRTWLQSAPYDGQWVPVAQLGGWVGPMSCPVLFRAASPDAVLATLEDWPMTLDSAGPDVWESIAEGERTYRAELHPVEERHGTLFHPFVAHFDPYTSPTWLEPIQAFVLFWKAWPVRSPAGDVSWLEEGEDAEPVEISRWRVERYENKTTVGCLEIRRDRLLGFLAAFEFDLAIYSDHRAEVPHLEEGWTDEGREPMRAWRCWATRVPPVIAVLRTVTILQRPPQTIAIMPWDRDDRSGFAYPIGLDRNTGKPIVATHPPQAFLTSVFFRETVLEKYYANPLVYAVEDTLLRGGRQWSLPIARTGRGTIHAWLGDVASLPRSVQQHWHAYAVVDEGRVPEWRIRTDFLAEFAEVPQEGPIARLRHAITSVNAAAEAWIKQPLYATIDPLHAESIGTLRIPANPSMDAFVEQIRPLAILVVDHLDAAFLDAAGAPAAEGPLNRLAALLERVAGLQPRDAKQVIGGLYAVQAIRSKVSVHRTGAEAFGVLQRAGISVYDLPRGFVSLVERAAASIEQIADLLRRR